MLISILFIWLTLFPTQIFAQEVTPSPIATPSATLTPSTAIATATPQPTATPTSAPPVSSALSNSPTPDTTINSKMNRTTSSQQLTGFGSDGLVEDKDESTGLGNDDGKVLGANESQIVDSSGDKDLLLTLILLTASVVLVVWTIYIILIQKGIIKSDTKKNGHSGGITPQPLL